MRIAVEFSADGISPAVGFFSRWIFSLDDLIQQIVFMNWGSFRDFQLLSGEHKIQPGRVSGV